MSELTDEQRTLISGLYGLITLARREELLYQRWAGAVVTDRPDALASWCQAAGETRAYASALRSAYGGRHDDAIRAAEAFGANLVPDDAPFDPMAMLSTPDAAHDRACELAGAGWLNQP